MYLGTSHTMHSNPYETARTNKGAPLFIPFVVLGDPDKEQSLATIKLLVQNGADALELGFPFSDPPADGPVIQAAGTRALAAGIGIDDCFTMLRDIRSFTDIPIGLLVYYNLVLQRGVEKFYHDCEQSGVASVLIADLPLEHADHAVLAAKKYGIAPIFLISELTTDERLEAIAKVAGGYLYVVSYLGVTGASNAVHGYRMRGLIERARKYTKLPLCVGFGINTVEQAKAAVTAAADGVIVGSRIVGARGDSEKIRDICREMVEAIRLEVKDGADDRN